jgi:hypothetical protein
LEEELPEMDEDLWDSVSGIDAELSKVLEYTNTLQLEAERVGIRNVLITLITTMNFEDVDFAINCLKTEPDKTIDD